MRTIRVTDHAVLRYLERVVGIDVEAARAQIAAKVAIAREHPGASGVRSDGYSYRLRGDAVTTVLIIHPKRGRI